MNEVKKPKKSFYGEEIQETSPLFTAVLTWVLPLLIFIGIGQYMSKKLMERAGGKNSMAFGMGKSNAKIYVKSSEGIKFSDVAGEDEAKESLTEIVEYLHNPDKYKEIGASMPKGILLVGPPGTRKTMLAKAAEILLENREKLDELSQYLYQKETITGEEFMKILNS